MQSALKQRWSGFVESMSPLTRQWATIGGLAAAAVAVLWAVFAMGSGDTAQRTASSASRTDLKPTNVDLMAPGSQVRSEEVWIGKAGRELAWRFWQAAAGETRPLLPAAPRAAAALARSG